MNKKAEVKCPNCKEVFKVDDSVYTDIVKQVRDQQFQEELNNRLATAEKEKLSALELKEAQLLNNYKEQLANKEREIDNLKFKSKSDLAEEVTKQQDSIRQLQSKIENSELQKKLELQNATSELEKK